MATGLDRIAQQDFSGGVHRAVRPELIPPNGVYDAYNALYDDAGAVYRRGGSAYRSTAAFGSSTTPLTFIWDGWLTPGQRTVIAHATAYGLLNVDGTVTSLAGTGMTEPKRAAVMNGTLYLPGGATYTGTAPLGAAVKVAEFYAVVANRLIAAGGDRIDFSNIGTPGTFGATDFHRLPGGVQILGIEGLRDALAVFTTDGLWVISNMAYNLTDAAGNVQHRMDRYSRDVILWGNAGIASWAGGLVVPALDAVWLISLGVASEAPQAFARISDQIAPLYQEYVRRGYRPGLATVHRQHYLLPIMSGSQVVDMLVCKLNSPSRPWSRLGDYGAQVSALAVRKSGTSSAQPVLVGASAVNGRVLNLSYMEPSLTAPKDADGSTHDWYVTTRDFTTGRLVPNTVVKLRASYQLVDAAADNPTMQAHKITGRTPAGGAEWGMFEWGVGYWSIASDESPLSGDAPEDAVGYKPYVWSVRAKERFIRFRLSSYDPAAELSLRLLEVFVRSNGRI